MTSIPTPLAAPGRAYARIVVALDGSPASKHALAWARAVAAPGAEVVPVSVVVPPYVEGAVGFPAPGWTYAHAMDAERGRAAVLAEEAEADLRREGLRARGVVTVGAPAERITRVASDGHADLVVVGSHGRGPLGRLILGSVADAVKTHAPCDVLVARSPPREGEVLAAVDGSRPATIAAATAARLAGRWRTRLVVLHVVDRLSAGDPAPLRLPPGAAAVTHVTSTGNPAERILGYAQAHPIGLVAMGSRGLGPVGSALAGSVSTRVVHEAACSVLLVKEARA